MMFITRGVPTTHHGAALAQLNYKVVESNTREFKKKKKGIPGTIITRPTFEIDAEPTGPVFDVSGTPKEVLQRLAGRLVTYKTVLVDGDSRAKGMNSGCQKLESIRKGFSCLMANDAAAHEAEVASYKVYLEGGGGGAAPDFSDLLD